MKKNKKKNEFEYERIKPLPGQLSFFPDMVVPLQLKSNK